MIELLAPAGNMECLHAAVRAGANAVYLGLEEFNARRNAGNFTTENLRIACDWAHLRGVKVYVTMNVEILPSELDRAVALALEAYRAGADALIVQDVGLARACGKLLPDIELHASTQMNIHSAAGIEAAARLGMKRVTLARELSIAEIDELSRIARMFGMEIECFAHGALCICYSGQCLMSSMIGGRSANRGLCAQACRLPYELHRDDRVGALGTEGAHLLSPRDLCAIDLLDQLAHAGVSSLKIEGRMKSADYVYEVVSVYREALDELKTGADLPDETRAARSDERKARLAEAFSRGFTTAYLEGERGNAMMSYKRPNNRGVFAGRVSRVSDGVANVSAEIELHDGDVLEFWTNKGHFTATVPAGSVSASREGDHSSALVPIEQRAGKGDRVFRVKNALAGFSDDANEPRITVIGHASIRVGEPAYIRFATETGVAGEAWGDIVEVARTKALTEDDVRKHIDRLGQTAFTIGSLDIDLSEGAGMGFSQLHRLRASALDVLETEMLADWRRRGEAVPPATAPSRQIAAQRNGQSRKLSVSAWASNPSCARAAKRAAADAIYVPVLNFRRGQAQAQGALQPEAEQAGYPKQCVMALPTIDHDPVEGTREAALAFDPWDYVREGKTVFADSIASALRAIDKGARVELGCHVPLTNIEALEFAAEIGVSRAWLSPELTLGQIAELAERSPIELGLFVSGSQELMICEHCLLMSQGPCAQNCESCERRRTRHWLVDRKGFEFPVATDLLGRSHLYNGIELDAAPTIPDLIDIGISAVMVDTTLMDKKSAEAAVRRVVRAAELGMQEHRAVEKRPRATTGHLFRGVL